MEYYLIPFLACLVMLLRRNKLARKLARNLAKAAGLAAVNLVGWVLRLIARVLWALIGRPIWAWSSYAVLLGWDWLRDYARDAAWIARDTVLPRETPPAPLPLPEPEPVPDPVSRWYPYHDDPDWLTWFGTPNDQGKYHWERWDTPNYLFGWPESGETPVIPLVRPPARPDLSYEEWLPGAIQKHGSTAEAERAAKRIYGVSRAKFFRDLAKLRESEDAPESVPAA